jgi:ribosomal-protein-alanine N-acetyltransferase
MKDSDIEEVHSIESNVHIAPWSKDILRDCVLVGYDCRVIEFSNNERLELGGYIISRISDNKYHILNFCIAKLLQSKGLGKKFLQSVLNSLSKLEQIQSVVLEVRPSNAVAIHLYTTLGFTQIDIKKDYYKDKENMEDAIFLEKLLK